MPDRSLRAVDDELSLAVKARDSARHSIAQLSETVILATRTIDQLLAERCELIAPRCPDTAEALLSATPTASPAPVIVTTTEGPAQ